MESQILFLVIGMALLLLVVVGLTFLFIWLIKNFLRNQKEMQRNQQILVDSILLNHQTSSTNFLEILDKSVTLLSAKDPISFQQNQAMNSVSELPEPVDNSDYGETMRWVEEEHPELSDHDKELIRAAGDF